MDVQIPIVERVLGESDLLPLLNEHHLLGLFHTHFLENTKAESLQHYKMQWIHNQVLQEEIQTLSHEAFQMKTSATLLKGAHLLLDIYSDLGSRFLSDVDLLIDEFEIAKWEQLLFDLGYTAVEQKTFYANSFKSEWCKSIGQVEINIELHSKLFFHLKKENWQRENSRFLNLEILKKEDLFLHLCGHLAFQHTFLKLYWLFDIYFYYQKYFLDLEWQALKKRSQELKLYRSVSMCLWILKEHFGVTLSSEVVSLFELDQKAWWQKLLSVDFLMYPLKSKRNYLLLKHATKDRFLSALRYDLSWFYHYRVRTLWS